MKNLGFVFPGQGSQKVGMLADLASGFALVEETFSEASAALGDRSLANSTARRAAGAKSDRYHSARAACRIRRHLAGLAEPGWAAGGDSGRAQPGRVLRSGLLRCPAFCRCRPASASAGTLHAVCREHRCRKDGGNRWSGR